MRFHGNVIKRNLSFSKSPYIKCYMQVTSIYIQISNALSVFATQVVVQEVKIDALGVTMGAQGSKYCLV